MNNKPKLTLIKGGAKTRLEACKSFDFAKVTNTGLMGAIYIYARYQVLDSPKATILEQFFYVDTEEFGIDNYFSLWDGSEKESKELETEMSGGLGGQFNSLKEEEFLYLIQKYGNVNIKNHFELPGDTREYAHYIEGSNQIHLSQEELIILLNKIYEKITNPYQAIHYFIMRSVGKDFDGAQYLALGQVPKDIFPFVKIGVMTKNKVTQVGHDMYKCESLIEEKGNYYIALSYARLTNINGKYLISGFEESSVLEISEIEAALHLSTPEYTSWMVLKPSFGDSDDHLDRLNLDLWGTTVITTFPTGVLFMIYNRDNSHVCDPIFTIKNDVFGSYFFSEFGEIIVSSSSKENMDILLEKLFAIGLDEHLEHGGFKYFDQPVFIDFIGEEYTSFESFLQDNDLI